MDNLGMILHVKTEQSTNNFINSLFLSYSSGLYIAL